MTKEGIKCLVISDFNTDNLTAFMRNDGDLPRLKPVVPPFGQVAQVLVEDKAEWRREEPGVAVIWTQPQSVVESFSQILEYKSVSLDRVLGEVDDYCSLIGSIGREVGSVFIPSWVVPSYHRGYGLLDMKNDVGRN